MAMTTPEPALLGTIAAVFAALAVGSIIRVIALRNAEAARRRQRFASLRTWWMLTVVTSAGLLVGLPGICTLLTVASCIAWFEITQMLKLRRADRGAVRAGYALIIANYLLIFLGETAAFAVFLPLGSMLVIAILILVADDPKAYIRSAGGLLWGLMFLGYGVSHAAFLLTLPAAASGPLGPAGWFIFLLVLTELDDISQAVVGRRFGAHKRHRITPNISPNKTWEGFFGGMLVICTVAPLIAPWLTSLDQHAGPFASPGQTLSWLGPILAAVLVAAAGFFGDINMSAVKRDAGVKDSSKLLPGMGGIIDRIDSLTMTAPVFVYFLLWWTA